VKSKLIIFCAFWWLFLQPSSAEQLPIKTYTTADGLPRDRVYKIVNDPRGFLWFCTNDGVSRFDGYEFTNYSTSNGLPHRVINDMLITKSGDYWVGTDLGVARFNPLATTPNAKFQAYHSASERHGSDAIEDLYEAADGTIWAATTNGLHRLTQTPSNWQLEYVSLGEKIDARIELNSIVEDTPGVLLIGTTSGLYRRFQDGKTEHFDTAHGLPHNDVRVVFKDRDGTVWLGTGIGLVHLKTNFKPGESIVAELYTRKDGLIHDSIFAIHRTQSNWLWIATTRGLSEFSPEPLPDGRHFINYSSEHGFSDFGIMSIAEDHDGNLWVGTESGGAMKITRSGFISYAEKDGLETRRIATIGEDRDGNFYAVTGSLGVPAYYINRFDGRRFEKIRVNLPVGVVPTWGWDQILMQDHAGEWWVPTISGLYRFPAVKSLRDLATARPLNVYTTQNGMGGNEAFRLYEDWRGDLWMAIITVPSTSFLNRWDRATGTIHEYKTSEIPLATNCPTAFQEDRDHNLWIGFYWGGLVRLRNGLVDSFTKDNGLPVGFIRDLYLDSSGRLWVASSDGGVARVDDPTREKPTFVTYSRKDGLSSDQITSVVEDRLGRMYLSTGIGVDRLDPATGHIKRYTTADGLANSYVSVSYRDRNGALWFGTLQGLSKLVVDTDKPTEPPPILIKGLRVAGNELPISDLGVKEAGAFEFEANKNQLEAKFVSPAFRSGEVLRYQLMLEGADNDWGAPIDQRTVTYANLKPGNYRFLVRAINADGVVSTEPAAITFKIIPPVWQRWWFVALLVVLLAAITHLIYRYHTLRLLELERVRTRIATDLHDDIGSSLSKIAILSDLAGQEVAVAESPVTGSLGQIADTSRDALDSMSDIVWAVNPQRDHLSDLTHRMRRFAEDLLDARDIDFTFKAPVDEKDIRLGADLRREVYLIFKECVNNLVKHSDCTRAELDFRIEGQWLVFSMSDNGSGFEPKEVSTNGGMGGHGLVSMQRRAQALGGSFTFDNNGTRVTLRVPLRDRQGWRSWFLTYPNGR
jgi:ligand-binding sensor domain-containing protein/signal transduction histidine kinase